MPLRRCVRFALSAITAFGLTGLPVEAADDTARMQLLFVGAAPEAGLGAAGTEGLPVISITALPDADMVRQEVFAARLRANPVSTFVATPSGEDKQFEQFFLVASAGLESGRDGNTLSVGADQFSMSDFADRLGSAVQAFDPRHRRIGFLHISDESDRFPMALPELRSALGGLGFDMMVLMISGQRAATCDEAQPLHYSLVGGLADRAPFGNGDGVSTVAEVQTYLSGALGRAKDRGCGPAYSLILKASDDTTAPLIVHDGATPFLEMENRLYHETFEAMFLMETQDVATMQAFLATCVYCPNEDALRDRLQAMEDAARTAELEGEIWVRIKDDSSRERLAIYVENCALCQYRDEALRRIALIDRKTAAADAELARFQAALQSRDLAALRSYSESCVTCAHLAESEALIAEIEADTAYMDERALLDDAVRLRSASKLERYLQSCVVCDGQQQVAETLAALEALEAVRQPCLLLAGLPQFDGPRKLEDIDQAEAMPVCQAAAAEFPDDGLLRTTIGRIAQAAGDIDAAKQSYVFGMEMAVPAAYGLAAYSYFAPQDGGAPDMSRAEDLALQGADLGDWLSHEILTVMYSKDLIAGKTARDAFEIAERVAIEGNPLAEFFVGYYYLTGTGTEVSKIQAQTWLSKSVEQGYTHAYSFLAELHETGGDGLDARPDVAADLYWKALEKGDPTATDRLTTQLGDRDRDVVRIIQERLREAGLYRGPVDGVPGRGTENAIREFADSFTGQG